MIKIKEAVSTETASFLKDKVRMIKLVVIIVFAFDNLINPFF